MKIFVAGSTSALERIRATAEELFGRLGVTVEVVPEDEAATHEPGNDPPLVVVHVDLSSPLEPHLLVIEGASGSELARRALPSTGTLETSVEEITHIAYSTVESLLEQRAADAETTSAAPPAPPAPTPEPPPAPSPVPAAAPAKVDAVARPLASARAAFAFGLDAGLGLSATTLGAERILPGAGLTLQARWGKGRQSLGILAAGAVHTASEVVFMDASVGLRPIVLRLLSTYDHAVHSSLSLVAGAGGGLDRYGIEPHQPGKQVRIRTGGFSLDPVVSGLLGIRAELVGPTFLTAAVALDVDLRPSRFVASTEDGVSLAVLEAPRTRPTLWVTVSSSVTRPSRFPQPGARQ